MNVSEKRQNTLFGGSRNKRVTQQPENRDMAYSGFSNVGNSLFNSV